MNSDNSASMARAVGVLPYRLALAGGWIDQPFMSSCNPTPPGSMVVVSLQPTFRWMDRSGICTSTRNVASRLWGGQLPDRAPESLVKELYAAENRGRAEPSGSQDMVGMLYPGISRLDYDSDHEGGVFPKHIESCNEAAIAHWLEQVLQVIPVAPRPEGYQPLGERNLDPTWVQRLGQSGADCYDAILRCDIEALGRSFNLCMEAWATLLPHVVRHPSLTVDLMGLLGAYQEQYPGAMFSGCGGGYLLVVSERPVPGGFQVQIRLKDSPIRR